MIYFAIALLAEAKPLIKGSKLSLEQQAPFQVYSSDSYRVIITGMGKENALMATSHLLTRFPPHSNDLLVNFGLAGAKEDYEIGSLVLAHTLHDKKSQKRFYPDMRLIHNYNELALTTVEKVQTHPDEKIEAVDMEAFAVYQAALLFCKSSQILTFKLISDHFSAIIPSKDQVNSWIEPHLQELLLLLENYQSKLPKRVSFSPLLSEEVKKTVATLKLTTSQVNQLNDALKGYLLRHKKEPLLPKHLPELTQHKKEQKDAFGKLINLLTA